MMFHMNLDPYTIRSMVELADTFMKEGFAMFRSENTTAVETEATDLVAKA
ncbi:MAG: hypothetical protein Q4C87_07075 [Actinomycetaceae bacterium]|nr:hypothetical protein [Actinomycetaceae bacterium]